MNFKQFDEMEDADYIIKISCTHTEMSESTKLHVSLVCFLGGGGVLSLKGAWFLDMIELCRLLVNNLPVPGFYCTF